MEYWQCYYKIHRADMTGGGVYICTHGQPIKGQK